MSSSLNRPFPDAEWSALEFIYEEPCLKWTAGTFERKFYEDMPLLLDRKGRVIDAPTSWLTDIRLNAAKRRTMLQYAYALRLYWAFLGRRDWTRPDDALLREWRNQMDKAGVSGRRINACLDVVVRFYVWAQSKELVVRRIGVTPPNGQPFPVSLVRKNGRRGGLVSKVRADANKRPRLPVPDITDIDELYEHLTGPDEAISERNCLMADLAVQCGLRREEFNSLNTRDIPTHSAIALLKERGVPHFLSVTGKGSKTRDVPMLPELAERLRDHIEGHRRELLGSRTQDSGALFLSRKTGDRLSEWWVSRLFTRAFGTEKNRRLTLHRLRARFASLVVLTLARHEMERRGINKIREDFVLMAAADVMGHGDIATLKRYVDTSIRTLQAEAAGERAPAQPLGVDVNTLEEVARQNGRAQMQRSTTGKRAAGKRSATGGRRV